MERFVAEVGAVRHPLGLREIHLYGHSWGPGCPSNTHSAHFAMLEEEERAYVATLRSFLRRQDKRG
ncbi:hypothetical protein [Actinoplanes sp. M2I2]|uniref:hypothetical protein n=1 Tax=Actinoplanes sp. M2I2 TaxID=1734444 RepID=UPI00202289D8|nr:hypothetical protein [Actinoplanes sp. M2I2]